MGRWLLRYEVTDLESDRSGDPIAIKALSGELGNTGLTVYTVCQLNLIWKN